MNDVEKQNQRTNLEAYAKYLTCFQFFEISWTQVMQVTALLSRLHFFIQNRNEITVLCYHLCYNCFDLIAQILRAPIMFLQTYLR